MNESSGISCAPILFTSYIVRKHYVLLELCHNVGTNSIYQKDSWKALSVLYEISLNNTLAVHLENSMHYMCMPYTGFYRLYS